MKSTAWIWFAGCLAWLMDGLINIHYHAWLHARIALTIALLFLVAALFYRQQKRLPPLKKTVILSEAQSAQ